MPREISENAEDGTSWTARMTRGIDAVLTLMGTQAPLYPLPFRIAYANLKHGTKRFDFPLKYESGNYKNTGVVPVSVKKMMSPLQQ